MTILDPILEELTQEPIPPLLKDDGNPFFEIPGKLKLLRSAIC